jgi:hypothetical protein
LYEKCIGTISAKFGLLTHQIFGFPLVGSAIIARQEIRGMQQPSTHLEYDSIHSMRNIETYRVANEGHLTLPNLSKRSKYQPEDSSYNTSQQSFFINNKFFWMNAYWYSTSPNSQST